MEVTIHLEGFEEAEGESRDLPVLFHLSCNLGCSFLPQIAAAAGVGDAHPENCLVVLWQLVQGKG